AGGGTSSAGSACPAQRASARSSLPSSSLRTRSAPSSGCSPSSSSTSRRPPTPPGTCWSNSGASVDGRAEARTVTEIDAPEPSPPEPSPPRAVDVVGRAIDLNLGGSAQIRRASIYAGLLFLAAIGPLAALLVAHSIRAGGIDWIIDLIALGRTAAVDLGPFAGLVVIVGVGCAIAISVGVQLLAIGLIGSRAADRSIGLHAAIGLARRRFWRLVLASIAVGLILIIPRQILATALGNQNAESGVLLSTALDIVLSAPFAYVGAAVVLAPATPLQAVRWSWRMARRRWR